MWFLTFWWELARWINANLVDLLYRSDAAKLSWLSVANNLYDRMVLQFVEGMMFLVLPTFWVGVLSWAPLHEQVVATLPVWWRSWRWILQLQ